MGFFSGMFIDFLSGAPFGFNCLFRTVIGYIAGFLNQNINYTGFIIREGKLDNMHKWMFNSIFAAACGVTITLLLCCTAAYAFVFCKFRGKLVA